MRSFLYYTLTLAYLLLHSKGDIVLKIRCNDVVKAPVLDEEGSEPYVKFTEAPTMHQFPLCIDDVGEMVIGQPNKGTSKIYYLFPKHPLDGSSREGPMVFGGFLSRNEVLRGNRKIFIQNGRYLFMYGSDNFSRYYIGWHHDGSIFFEIKESITTLPTKIQWDEKNFIWELDQERLLSRLYLAIYTHEIINDGQKNQIKSFTKSSELYLDAFDGPAMVGDDTLKTLHDVVRFEGDIMKMELGRYKYALGLRIRGTNAEYPLELDIMIDSDVTIWGGQYDSPLFIAHLNHEYQLVLARKNHGLPQNPAPFHLTAIERSPNHDKLEEFRGERLFYSNVHFPAFSAQEPDSAYTEVYLKDISAFTRNFLCIYEKQPITLQSLCATLSKDVADGHLIAHVKRDDSGSWIFTLNNGKSYGLLKAGTRSSMLIFHERPIVKKELLIIEDYEGSQNDSYSEESNQ